MDPNCYPLASIFECSSKTTYIDTISGGLLSIPVFFFAKQTINKYFLTKNDQIRIIVSFFIFTVYSLVSLLISQFLPLDIDPVVLYVFQIYPRALSCISYAILAEQIASILCIMRVRFAKIYKIIILLIKYLFLLIAVVFAFLVFLNPVQSWKDDPYNKAIFFMENIYPFIQYAYLVLYGIFIFTAALTFILLPEISGLFNPRETKIVKILLFFITFFFLIWNIVNTILHIGFDYSQMIYIHFGLHVMVFANIFASIISEYIPKTLSAFTMWYLSYDSDENQQETNSNNQPDVINEDMLHADLFPL